MIKTTLGIEGMMCGMCESHINNAIRNNFKVKKVNSSKNNGQTEIISEELLDKNKLKEVIEEVKSYGCTIQDALEIGSSRDIEF